MPATTINMRPFALAILFLCPQLAIPASAQTITTGSSVPPAIDLLLYPRAPSWWNLFLSSPTGTLEANQPVTVLQRRSHNTLLGQDEWFLVETRCNADDPDPQQDCTELSGWIQGIDDSLSHLTPE